MARPDANWLQSLPKTRLIAEFSVWSADLGALRADLARVEPHVDMLHIDVSDGHFTAALLFFPDQIANLRKATAKPMHVHLMVTGAVLLSQIEQFAEAGADLISIHAETDPAILREAFARIAALGLKAGLVLQLETPVEQAEAWLADVAMLTLVSTPIGIKGVQPDETTYLRLAEARALLDAKAPQVILAADGGIREHTVPRMRAEGAQTVVLGSLAFNAPDLAARMAWLATL